MIVVRPVTIDDAALISTNVPETDYPAYDPAATYNTGDRVTVADVGVHSNYECVADATTGLYPPDNPVNWLDIGPTNPWAMFDTKVGTQTANADQIAVSIQTPTLINAIGVVNVWANAITVTVTDGVEGVVYQRTDILIDPSVSDWYGFFFEPIGRKTSHVILDLPAYLNAQIDITIDYVGDVAKCGALVAGSQVFLGDTQYGLRAGILDYSRKQVDMFGNWQVIERGYSDTAGFDLQLPTGRVSTIKQTLAPLRAVPALYIGDADEPATHVFGYFRDFQINLATPTLSEATITVEGLT